MKIINNAKYMFFYLKGVLRFRAKEYTSALQFFKRAMKYLESQENELFCQYYGQTLLCLNKIDESFAFLSMAYNIYNRNGWTVANDEEYQLVKGTLDALKYLDDNFNLKLEDFEHEKNIILKNQ